ncbi:MAG: lipopolysaccharide biosynthesis protein [Gemmatimonadaceae bacterium]|nr:lipopolysaccharide biosynthesis protein [Gemmatimonadaceae bacterium]
MSEVVPSADAQPPTTDPVQAPTVTLTRAPGGRAPGASDDVTAHAASMDSAELRGRFLSGVLWQGSLRWLAQILSWASTLVVARHLSLEAYGIVSVSVVVVAITGYVTEAGIGRAIVLRNVTDRNVLGQLHSVAAMLGVAFAVALVLLATPIAWFFDNAAIAAPLMCWSVAIVIGGLVTVPAALLQQRLAYRTVALIELARSITQALVVLTLAVLGAGYWALIAGFLAASVLSLGSYLALAWLPLARPRLPDVRGHLHYARHVVTGNLAWYAYSNCDFVVVGRVLSVTALGLYQFAWNIAQLPGEKLTNVVQAAIAPVLGALSERPDDMRELLMRATALVALLVFPVLVGLGIVAPLVIPILFGERWLPAVPALRLLLAFGMMQAVTVSVVAALNARGRARLTGLTSVALACVSPFAFVIAAKVGELEGVALVHVMLQPFVTIFMLRESRAAMGLRLSEFARALRPAGTSCALMAVACLVMVRATVDVSAVPRVVLVVVCGGLVYSGILASVYRTDVEQLLRSFRGARAAST